VVCGDARPCAAGDEFVRIAETQESVAQRGVCDHHDPGAHGQDRCPHVVSGDRPVEIGRGAADECGDVPGLEVDLWSGIGGVEFVLHVVA
jgi:hypothetical protein